jgi:hypothetical protein
MYMPPNVSLPLFIFNLTGIQDNIMFDDTNMKGIPLIFSQGIQIFGETAYI